MLQNCLIAASVLFVVLYAQTRVSAYRIRRNRRGRQRDLVLGISPVDQIRRRN